jgi:hypothetical protein
MRAAGTQTVMYYIHQAAMLITANGAMLLTDSLEIFCMNSSWGVPKISMIRFSWWRATISAKGSQQTIQKCFIFIPLTSSSANFTY